MNVLITPQFNAAMASLSSKGKEEVSSLYTLVTSLSRSQLQDLPLLTKLEGSSEDIYTLHTSRIRIFCSFNTDDKVIFLSIEELVSPRFTAKDNEVALFTPSGKPVAYIDTTDENTIFAWDGRPLAYVDGDSKIYGFNGRHLGWFEDDVIWDHDGKRVGFTAVSSPVSTQMEPFKRFKRFKPFKRFKRFAKFKRFKKRQNSGVDLLSFLEQGKV